MTLINKLIGTGANCIYLMAIRSHGGDGGSTENPYINSDPSQGLSDPILNQWETWFAATDANGITIYFIFYDDRALPFGRELPESGELKPEEVVFLDTMVSRFKHHKHLIWCVAEECAEGLSTERSIKVAQRIREQDNHGHPIAIHQDTSLGNPLYPLPFDFNGIPYFDQFSLSWNKRTIAELYAGVVSAWNDVNGSVNINLAEFNGGTGAQLRHSIWSIALGGGYSMVLGMDIASTTIEDLKACGRLVGFMEATRFNETSPRNDLKRAGTMYVLADPGNVYLAYGLDVDGLSLLMEEGIYAIRWYNPINGQWVDAGRQAVQAGPQRFVKPSGIDGELVLYIADEPLDEPFIQLCTSAINHVVDYADMLAQDEVVVANYGSGMLVYSVSTDQSWLSVGTSNGALEAGQTSNHTISYSLDALSIDTHQATITVSDAGSTPPAVNNPQTIEVTVRVRTVLPDLDLDGDVDQEDFGLFQLCYGTQVRPGCEKADFNGDKAINQLDFAVFLGCYSGAGVLADKACDDAYE
ncbi:MAG: hypothetical protein GXY44_16020 [Phycisphaerales bacterium]|nr:hypothetical protein [Phycisphaerales bacterium]